MEERKRETIYYDLKNNKEVARITVSKSNTGKVTLKCHEMATYSSQKLEKL